MCAHLLSQQGRKPKHAKRQLKPPCSLFVSQTTNQIQHSTTQHIFNFMSGPSSEKLHATLSAYFRRSERSLLAPLVPLSINTPIQTGIKSSTPLEGAHNLINSFCVNKQTGDHATLLLAFKCVYSSTRRQEDIVSLVKKHQHYVVFLNSKALHKLAIEELSTLYNVFILSPLSANNLLETLLEGVSPPESYPLSLVISFHFFVIQSILQSTSSRVHSIVKSGSSGDLALFFKVACSFLRSANFGGCLARCDLSLSRKYHLNGLKMLSGFVKLAEYVYAKNRSPQINLAISALKLKTIEYQALTGTATPRQWPTSYDIALKPFIEDLRNVLPSESFSEFLSRCNSSLSAGSIVTRSLPEEQLLEQEGQRESQFCSTGNGTETYSLDTQNVESIVTLLLHSKLSPNLGTTIFLILQSMAAIKLRKFHYSIFRACVAILETTKNDQDNFDQYLKTWIPRLALLLIQERQKESIQTLSILCFDFARIASLTGGYNEACQLDIALLRTDHSTQNAKVLVNRIEYSICALFDLGASVRAVELAKAYVRAKPGRLVEDMVPEIIASAIATDPSLILFFFGHSLFIAPNLQNELFLSLLQPLGYKISEDEGLISTLVSSLPNELLLASYYRVSLLFKLDVGQWISNSLTVTSDLIFRAGILANRFEKNKPDVGSLNSCAKYVLDWVESAQNSDLTDGFVVFAHVVRKLIHMGSYSLCIKLVSKFERSALSNPRDVFELESLLARCLLETHELERVPEVLKSSSVALKTFFSGTASDFDELVNLKLTQLEFYIKSRDRSQSRAKFEEIKIMITSKPEYNPSAEVTKTPLHVRLACFITIARFLLLASMINTMSAEMIRAMRNLKLAIKVLSSALRKIDSRFDLQEMKESATLLLLKANSLSFKTARHLGLSHEASHHAKEFSEVNLHLDVSPLKTFQHFVAANYLMYVGNATEAMKELQAGENSLWESTFLRFAYLAASITVHFDMLSAEEIASHEQTLKLLLPELERLKAEDYFTLHLLQMADLMIEAEFLLAKRRVTGSTIYQNETDVTEMLSKAIISTRAKITDVSMSPSTVEIIKKIDSLVAILPVKKTKPEGDLRHRLFSECAATLMRFGEKAFFPHLETGSMLDVNALLDRCIHLLSFFETRSVPEMSEFIIASFLMKDLAYTLPYMNQKAMVMQRDSSDKPTILPTLDKENANELSIPKLQKTFFKDLHNLLPASWAVVTIDFCKISGDLLISRLDKRSDCPRVLKIPFDRKEHTKGTFIGFLEELKSVIADSNNSTKKQVTSKIFTKEDRKAWWTARFNLDARLRALLQKLEKLTIGGLLGVFSSSWASSRDFRAFEVNLNEIWNDANDRREDFKLDKAVVDLFFYARNHLKEEALKYEAIADLTEYTAEQLNTHVLINNIKNQGRIVDRILRMEQAALIETDDEHLILVPGHSCQFVPWESMSFLRNRSVSRMPSVTLLFESLRRHKDQMTVYNKGDQGLLYVVNPASDLIKTQARFEPVLDQIPGAKGVAGVIPREEWLTANLFRSNLYIYLGHGGGEQYIRSSGLFRAMAEENKRLPTTLLMGCSSSAYKEHGRLQPSSNIYKWFVCGAPAVMTNLWDITDKDIDIFSLSLLAEWGLAGDGIGEPKTLARAMVKSRDACTLRFLNGAAPILHGLPLKLR